MSDYPYPTPKAEWYKPREEKNPFPQQIVALEKIRDGVGGRAYFVETMFNPWKVAENLSSVEAVRKLQREKPQALLDALEVIAKSEANHARRSVAAGAAGVFVAIANAQHGYMTQADYAKFSEPFDKLVLEAVRSAPLNILHLHGDKVYLDRFYQGWPAQAINYSAHGTGVSIAQVRAKYSGVILGGLDEVNYRKLSAWISSVNGPTPASQRARSSSLRQAVRCRMTVRTRSWRGCRSCLGPKRRWLVTGGWWLVAGALLPRVAGSFDGISMRLLRRPF